MADGLVDAAPRAYPDGAHFGLSLTFDIEMVTNFPYWTSVWDHRKGAIDEDVKAYIRRITAIAAEAGVRLQWFLLGASLEDPDIDYLRALVEGSHALGNHTYHHVNVKAQTIEQLQVVYRERPWLAAGRTPREVIQDEVRQTNEAIQARLGVSSAGFRTPGGFPTGLHDVPEIQRLLLDAGFTYVSSQYRLKVARERRPELADLMAAACASIAELQPYRYPSGLLEIPMMGMRDVWAFRVLRLDKAEWLQVMRREIVFAAAQGLLCSLLFHPAVLASRDPFCETVYVALETAAAQPGRCWHATNDAIAQWHAPDSG